MLNTDIFKFEFVDRTAERHLIDKYLNDFTKSLNYALWIHGKRGTGKSFFLTEYIVPKNQFESVYVNVDIGNNTPGTYLKILISQLNKTADLKFTNYLRANYRSIATIGQKAVNVVLNLTDLDDIGLDEVSSSITNYFISKHGEKENTVSVVKKYFIEALKKCNNLVIIFDNFSQCDSASLDVIASVVHELINNKQIKFIFCTTDDDLENRFDIKSVLAEKIPNMPIDIQPFKHRYLFARMLEQTFDLNELTIPLLSQTFEICKGFPQRFKEILINLYTSQGIIVNDDKAQFVLDAFRQLLIKGEISFDINSICQEYKGAKIVLMVIALWGEPISTSVLNDFLDFFSNTDPLSVFKEELRNTLHILEDLHVLIRSYEKGTILIQYEHDSLKIAVKEYFRDDRSIPFLHFSIYEYLKTIDLEFDEPYWHRYYRSLIAYHSFAAQTDDWIEYNYSFGYSFFEVELYNEAQVIFSRLESAIALLSGEKLLTICITLFYCGQYYKADDILANILSRNLINSFSLEQIITLYIFQARTKSCILDNKNALKSIERAENLGIEDERLRILILGVKQSILFLKPGGFTEAKALFDDLVNDDLKIHEMALIYQSAMDYYEGVEAQNYLNKGLVIAREFSDHIVEAKILNNMGFEHLRCENYEEALCLFEESITILKEKQPHEQAFPYSNLSVLYMISENWEKALETIIEGIFWNKSDYVSLVLKTNRMLCYYFSGNEHWEKIYKELYNYIEVNRILDDKIYKKICINMALLALKNELFIDGKYLLDICRPHLENEWPHGKFRFLKLYEKLTGNRVELTSPPDPCYQQYYCDLEFEPWLVNFSHD